MAYLPPAAVPVPGMPTSGMVAPPGSMPPGAGLGVMGPNAAGMAGLPAPYAIGYPGGGIPGSPFHAPPTAVGFQPLFPAYQTGGMPPGQSNGFTAPPPPMLPNNNNSWGYADPSKLNNNYANNPYQMNPVITQQPQPGWTQNTRYHKYGDSDSSDGEYVVGPDGQRTRRRRKKKNGGCCGDGCGCCNPTALCCAFCIWLNCCPKDYDCLGCFDCLDCDCADGCGNFTDCGDCDGCDNERD